MTIAPEAVQSAARRRLVVVGNGMVSHRLCRTFSETPALARRYELVVIGEEPLPAYDRTRLSEGAAAARPAPLLDAEAWYARAGIRLELGVAAIGIDRSSRAVRLADGRTEPYDLLVLATGAEVAVPVIEGVEGPGVLAYRRYSDVERMREAARHGRRAAIVGGGLLGLEAARVLLDLGLYVHVVENGRALMGRQLDAESGAILGERARALGIETHLGVRLQGIERRASSAGSATPPLRLALGEALTLDVDLVVFATGIRPRDELAVEAGLRVGARGGVIVDDQLRTSDPSIFAVGECALHRGALHGLVAPGYEMADVLVAHLAGERRRFEGADSSCELKLLGVPVAAVGFSDQEGHCKVYADADVRRTLVLDGRRLLGATSVGAWPQLGRVRDAAMRGAKLSQGQIDRFLARGELWDDQGGVVGWPARTVVCACKGVTRGELSACVAAGCVEPAALMRRTGAGSVCGSCRPLLGELVGRPVTQRTPGARLVLAASVATLLVAPLLVAFGPVPAAASVQAELYRINELWRHPLSKQITGFTLLGLSLLGMLLSARKRIGWFKFGAFGAYRALHTSVSCAALVLTAGHTGMRMGQNVNFALMCTFLAVALVGALTGLATSLESGGTSAWAMSARRVRPALTLLHVLFLWPLPLLLGLHVFAVYYF